MSYDNDGTVVGYRVSGDASFGEAWSLYADGTLRAVINGSTTTTAISVGQGLKLKMYWFFPEVREVSACAYLVGSTPVSGLDLDGSTDTTNGNDGTWETASFPGGNPITTTVDTIDDWRKSIRAVSFTGGKRVIRSRHEASSGTAQNSHLSLVHWYGEKATGETPDDLIFIDHDTTPGVEYTAPEDFGDRPLGTSVVRQFRVKNASATLTANSINLQCNDSDFAISTDGTTWVTTINIASLAAGAESATLYIRNTTPAPGNTLGPRFARIIAIVGSWS